jgi:uncharacterized repeat protein (TIGR01451 family)
MNTYRSFKAFCSLIFTLSFISTEAQTWIGANKIGMPVLSFNYFNDFHTNPIAADPFNNVVKIYNYRVTTTIGSNTYTNSNNNNVTNAVVVKTDANNNLIWSRNLAYGFNNFVKGGSVYCDNQSNIYVTGIFGDPSLTSVLNCNPFPLTAVNCFKFFIIKYSPSGVVLWSRDVQVSSTNINVYFNNPFYGLTGNGTNRIAFTAPVDPTAPPIVVGSFTVNPAVSNCMVGSMDNNGNWLGIYGVPVKGNYKLYGQSLAVASNNDIYVSATHNDTLKFGGSIGNIIPGSTDNGVLFKLNSSMQPAWAKAIPSCPGSFPPCVVADGNDALLNGGFQNNCLLGSTTLTTSATYANYLSRIDNSGNYLASKKMGDGISFQRTIRNASSLFMLGGFQSYATTLQVDAVNLSSLLTPTSTSWPTFLVETDLNGNALNGNVTYLNDAVQAFGCDNSGNAYIGGYHNTYERFGSFAITGSAVAQKYFYVAKYSNKNNLLSGKTYYDLNSNNMFDAGDLLYNGAVITRSSTDTLTSYSGYSYKTFPPAGTYTTGLAAPPLYYNYTPVTYVNTFTANFGQTDTTRDFILQPVSNQNDIKVMTSGTPFNRPGFSAYMYATIKNIGTINKSGVAQVSLDANLTYMNTFPAAMSASGNTINLAYTLTPTQSKTYLISYSLAPSVPVGINLLTILTATNAGDLTIANNTDSLKRITTASYDPNEKEVSAPASISPQFVSNGNYLNYTIHFQNTGSDTAFHIILNDTLSSNLDLTSFEVLNSSHPLITDLSNNIANFKFYNINLPDSNTNEPISHGFVSYRAKPLNTLVVGDQVKNRAHIYFDFNAPVPTNQTINTVSIVTGINETAFESSIVLYPNPTSDVLYVKSSAQINKVEIINVVGQLIASKIVDGNTAELDVKYLKTGMHLIRIQTAQGTTLKKIVVQ